MQALQSFTVVLSAPSGTGKGTLIKRVRESNSSIRFSVSTTTRQKREGETDGLDYDFVTPEVFHRMRRKGLFVEWAQVHGNWYGTSYKSFEKARSIPGILILEIDVQGARLIGDKYPDVHTVFVLPPSRGELETRIRNRSTETEETINTRLSNAVEEIREAENFDWWIVNRTVDQAAEDFLHLLNLLVEGKNVPCDEFRCEAVYNRVRRTFSEIRTFSS
jgi:guanylate kinase